MTRVVTSARVSPGRLPEILTPRNGLVVEEPAGAGLYRAVRGPVHDYCRTLEVTPADGDPAGDVNVCQTVTYDLAVPFFGWLFGWPFRRSMRRLGAPGRHPWWAPPDPLDPRAASMLASLCALAAVAAYPGILLGQTIEFAREEMGFLPSAQSLALAAVRGDFVVALGLVAFADRKGRRQVTLGALAAGCVLVALGSLAPDLGLLTGTQVAGRGCLTGALILMGIMAAEEMPANSRAYAVSLLSAAGALGAGMALASLPLADLGVRGWRLPFALSLVGVPLVAVIGRRLPESRRFRMPHAEVGMRGHGRRLWLLGVSAFLFSIFLGPASQYQNVFLRRERGFSGARIALFTIATNVWGGIGIVAGGRLADVRGRRVVASVGVVGGVGATVAMFFSTGWTIWAWSVVGAVIGAATVPALGVYGPELFPTSLRGRANGIISGLGRAGSVAGLLFVAAVINDRTNLAPVLALLALGPALLVVLVLVAYPETAHRELEDLNPEDAPPIASDP
ncbi:MAG: MFS transporter [Actinobacteria bacterium]|nr:MFS transporter [Actinomycetota bacterium]